MTCKIMNKVGTETRKAIKLHYPAALFALINFSIAVTYKKSFIKHIQNCMILKNACVCLKHKHRCHETLS